MPETTGVLLIHGFAGDPGEVRLLRDRLIRKGYPVACPLLQGHGLTKKELSRTTCGDWIDSAERSCLELSKQCDRIVAIGFSMGGLIAVNLWNYGFAGLVTVNTPIYYWDFRMIAGNLIRDFRRYGKSYFKASTDKAFRSLLEFQKLLTQTKPMFAAVTCKTLVVQALDDDTVNRRSADYILKKIPAETRVYRLAAGGHQILRSGSGPEVCSVIEEFIESLGEEGAARLRLEGIDRLR